MHFRNKWPIPRESKTKCENSFSKCTGVTSPPEGLDACLLYGRPHQTLFPRKHTPHISKCFNLGMANRSSPGGRKIKHLSGITDPRTQEQNCRIKSWREDPLWSFIVIQIHVPVACQTSTSPPPCSPNSARVEMVKKTAR